MPRSTEHAGQRVLVYCDGLASIPAVCKALVSSGFDVQLAGSFQELSALLVCRHDRTLLILHPPLLDTFRRAVLDSIRRLAPTIPTVVLVSRPVADAERILTDAVGVRFLDADSSAPEITGAVTRLLAVQPTREPSGEAVDDSHDP